MPLHDDAPRRAPLGFGRRQRMAVLMAPLALAAAGITACSKTDTASTGTSSPGSSAATGGTTGGTGGSTTGTAKTSGSTPGTTKAQADVPKLTVTAVEEGDDYLFEMPDELETGWAHITLDNKGELPHQINIAKLQESATIEQVQGLLASEAPDSVAALVETWIGGPNGVPGGTKGEGYVNFSEPGTYVALCFLSSPPDMKMHVAHGMFEMIEVTGESTAGKALDVETAGEIEMKDFEWFLPDDFEGNGLYKLSTLEGQPHEISVLALEEGKSVDDVMALLSATEPPTGPPPFTDAGGFGAVSYKNDAYMQLDLKPGKYVLICFLPDAPPPEHDLKPHFTHGMIKEIEIT